MISRNGRSHRTSRLFPGLVLAVLVASTSAVTSHAGPGPGFTETGKTGTTCKAGQASVTFFGRTKCRKLRPVPDTGDQRLALFRAAILQDVSGMKTRRGTVIPPFSRIASGRAGRARTRIVAALPEALAWADSHIREEKGRSRSAAPCGAIDGSKDSTKIGSFDLTLTGGGDLTVSGDLPGGYRIEVFVGKAVPGCALDLSACPTADGTLDGKDAHVNTIIVKVTRNGQIVQSTTIKVRSTQTMKGNVADDAKLDTMSLNDTARETTTVILPSDRVTLLLTVQRSTEVDMRSGQPKPGSTKVNAQLQIVGATQTFRTGTDPAAVKKYTEQFSEIISEEVGRYRSRETAWQTPGACANLTFDPASNGTRKLKDGESGQVTGKVESNQGGVATKGKWRVTSQANGIFTPPTAEGGTAPFTYLVTNAGDNIRLAGAFRATSTAGVAEGTWSQPTQGNIKRIAGTFGGTWTAPTQNGTGVITFNGNVTFDRPTGAPGGVVGDFELSGGGYTVNFSGGDVSGGTGCQMSGVGNFTLPAGREFGYLSVVSTGPNLGLPWGYLFVVQPPFTDRVTVTRSSCPGGAGDGTTIQLNGSFANWAPTRVQQSADGLTYAGSEDQTVLGSGQVISWSFTGSE